MKNISSLLVLVTLLSGCIASRMPYDQKKEVNGVDISIAEAAASISRSMVELNRVEKEADTSKYKRIATINARDLQGVASIDWSGPIEPLVKHLANASRYKFRKISREPAIPVIITLTKNNAPISSILQEIDYLAGSKAYIRVNSKKKSIELKYA